jgi:hypothetical protein
LHLDANAERERCRKTFAEFAARDANLRCPVRVTRTSAKRRIVHACDRCNTYLFRCATLDAWWCARCDRWAEGTCGDPACFACVARPERPSIMLRRQREVLSPR